VIGTFLGGVVGFLLRPSVPLIGQLPLETVIARGSNLSGLDSTLGSTAERSFAYMVVGAMIGAIVLGAMGSTYRKPSATNPATTATAAPPPTVTTANSAPSPGRFCTKCGTALGSDAVFCGACGTRRE
jgi:hypothetical protein